MTKPALYRSLSLPMKTPTTADTAMDSDMAPDTAARDQPNSSPKGLINKPKQVGVARNPAKRRTEAPTITQP